MDVAEPWKCSRSSPVEGATAMEAWLGPTLRRQRGEGERKVKTLGGEAGLLIGARRGSAGCLGGHVCSSSVLL